MGWRGPFPFFVVVAGGFASAGRRGFGHPPYAVVRDSETADDDVQKSHAFQLLSVRIETCLCDFAGFLNLWQICLS